MSKRQEELREKLEAIPVGVWINGVWHSGKLYSGSITDILQACKEANMAFVDRKAELPPNNYWAEVAWNGRGMVYGEAQRDMLKAGWHKVEEIEV